MDYKRLTYKGQEYNDPMYKRLQELEDKITSHTLIELPYKVGDTVYIIGSTYMGWRIKPVDLQDNGDLFDLMAQISWGNIFYCYKTKEEAEAKLKELRGQE